MNILFLQNVLFDYRVDFYNQLSLKGFNVTVVHSGKKNTNECFFEQLIVPKICLPKGLYIQRCLPNFSQYDVVISMFDLHWLTNIYPVIVKRSNRFIFWGHGLGKSPVGNKVRKWLVDQSDGLVLYNHQKLALAKEYGFSASKLSAANNTIYVSNHGRSSQLRKQFLFVGRIQERKRIDIFIKAFAKIKSEASKYDVSISIIGEGEYKLELEQLAKEIGIGKYIRFLGSITDDNLLKEEFDKTLAYVSPGPMGLSVNHAFAYGVPTLSNKAYQHGPEAWILNDKNSVWFDALRDEEQIEQLSERMMFLIENHEQAKVLGENAYQDYLNHCSMDNMVNGFVEVFSQKL